jgi:hypothetical protein
MLVARMGDTTGSCSQPAGCANGTYYMNLTYIGGTASPDPVMQLIPLYNAWRAGWAGHADHVKSKVTFDKAGLTADGLSQAEMTIQLFDINGAAITTGAAAVTVGHDPSSTGSCAIGPVQNLGNGSYKVLLTAGTTKGLDIFRVIANDGKGNVLLYPLPQLPLAAPCVSYGTGTPGTGGLTPVLDCGGAAVIGNASFGFAASSVAVGAPVSFCASYGTASLPFSPTGMLLVDPFNLAWVGGPIAADASGNAVVAAPIPNDVSLAGMHVFAQALALDAGGDIGLSATQGLDIEIH